MNKLGEKSLKTLEYYEILERLAAQAASEAAKEKCRALRPLDDREQAELWMRQTTDAKDRMVRQGSPSFGGIREVGAILIRADRGGTLNPRELLAVASLLQTARRALLYDAEHENKTTLTPIFGLLSGNRDLEESITTAIISEEEIADGASPELLSIRRELRRVSGKVRETLNRMISGERSKYLQENIITQRNGRFVVPVKVEHRGDVPGLVHDTSSTGATVFVEPQQVVEINNQIKVLEGREENEIERILAELSSRVSMYKGAIEQDYDALTTLDFIFARAKLSFDMNACAPVLVEDGSRCKLLRARHPLLDKDKAVPIDIAIGYDYDTLVITGPNTGGKTVTLKTAGLLCAMAQCGFLIPADERSEICVFDEFLVDIGDEQSIEQSLSTFSGHMKKITGILELAMPRTLVLLDELGAGTDPAEGAALAVAIIEELRRRGVLLMATTHYAELKVFALETKGVVNASCEFDLETLRPTYKLSVGVPGKSNAFLISEKLGIPERVIEAAQQHLSAEDKRLDAVLGQLDDLKLQLKESQDEVEELRNEAAHQLDAARKKRDELIQQGENELEAARAKARALAQQVESKAYALTDELRQLQKDERMSTQQKAQRAREIAKKESEKLFIGTEVVHNPVKEFVPLKEVKVGQEVCIAELNQLATVLALPDKNGDVLVRAGIIKTKVPLLGLKQPEKLVKEPQAKTKAQQRYSRLTGDANRPNGRVERVQRSAKMECNLLGLTVDEALPEVDSFIDRAILNGQTVVYLIHGNGTGALRTAIHKHLRGNRMVKSFRLGRYGEGESGVTVVELK